MSPIKSESLPVKNRIGEVLFHVSAAVANDMLKRGVVRGVGTKNFTRALVVSPDHDDSKVIPLAAYVGQRYSHSHDTKDNPEGCWTLKRLPKSVRPVFCAVQISCMKEAA